MLGPICKPCQQQMRVSQNDFVVNDPASGPFPSTYWRGDVWKCPKCEAEIVAGLGESSLSAYGSESLEFQY